MNFNFNGKEFPIYSADIKSRNIYSNGHTIGTKLSILDLENKDNKIEFSVIIDNSFTKDKKRKFPEKVYVEIMEICDEIYENSMLIDDIIVNTINGELAKLSYNKDGEVITLEANK